jgi:hypothetical protein
VRGLAEARVLVTEKTMQDTTRTCGTPTTISSVEAANFSVIFDYSDFEISNPYGQFPLLIRCCTCKQLFASDYEETHCAQCVADRELIRAIAV